LKTAYNFTFSDTSAVGDTVKRLSRAFLLTQHNFFF